MQGYQVKRKAGWDTHGLPVELGVEKMLGITKEDIGKNISVEQYNDACRREVMKYTREWEDLTKKMGYWVDMTDPYITYDNRYIETLWYLLKQLYDKGLLYKGYTIQPYSPAAGTGLSTHELNQPGAYRDVKDTTCIAQFKVKNNTPQAQALIQKVGSEPVFFVAWTTTPWTLPSNTALAVGANIDYVLIKTQNQYTKQSVTVVLAESLLMSVVGKNEYELLAKFSGKDIECIEYEQLFDWVNPILAGSKLSAFRVICGDFVTTEDGTGIVHIAPTFGADDDKVAKQNGIAPLFVVDKKGDTRPMVDLTGKYFDISDLDDNFVKTNVNLPSYRQWAGRFVKNAYDQHLSDTDVTLDVDICMELKQRGQVFKIEKHTHNYPHCWRTDKPVLYYPLDSWFIRTTAVKDEMIALNDTINWKPQSTGSGRFGKWLENLNDWNLSRSRYWGTPLPIWRNTETREEVCIGSIQELYDEIEKAVAAGVMKSNPLKDKGFVPGDYSSENYHLIDLHRPYVDDIVLVSPTGAPMHRESDLIDVWFDSGAMPYAQIHYPFEHKAALDNRTVYPADFIAEGVDQTRGWFFTLHAIATMVFDSVAFKAVISNGLVLDKNGQKMSKRLGNAVDPFAAIREYGSDPVRWYMITNSAPWDNLKFDSEGVLETSRTFFGKLIQTYSFFSMYANVDGFDPDAPQVPVSERPEIDRWILSELHSLIREVQACYEDYEPTKAGRLIQSFTVDNLSNWYVRLNRKRYWAGEMTTDKQAAYQTLYTCLLTLSRLMAPIAPFYADRLYKDLTAGTQQATAESVHLDRFPVADESLIDSELEARMELAQQTTSLVLSLRKKERIIVRQPLQRIAIPVHDARLKARLEAVRQLILDEVNVKAIDFVEGNMLEKKVKCNFRVMGKKFGKLMKAVNNVVTSISQEQIAELETRGQLTVNVEGQDCLIERSDVEIISEDMPGWSVANEGALTVALDITITDELRNEGVAREIVKRIQALRKDSGFEITDRIHIVLESNPAVERAVADYKDFICAQVLGESLEVRANVSSEVTFDVEGAAVKLQITKA